MTASGNGVLTVTDGRSVSADGVLSFGVLAEPYAFAIFEIEKE